jgi:putative ABC transport system ATP-binding protein
LSPASSHPLPSAPATALAVDCRGVTKTYRNGSTETVALRGVDLQVRPGELLMLMGPSGCGKTTLISVMAGILDQDQGSCRVFGAELKQLRPRLRTVFRGRNLGFVFQAFNLLPALSARENVAVPLLILGQQRRQALERAQHHLELVGIPEKGGDRPARLSGGQQQRVAIARALVHSPRLIVCDEPTSALDHRTGERVIELLRSVALGEGRALVIVTHDQRILGYADKIAHMDDGKILRVEARSGREPS